MSSTLALLLSGRILERGFFGFIAFISVFGLGLLVPYTLAVVISRLYRHPLSRFPGPPLAAITTWYESYHETILGGTFMLQYQKWHDQYGSVIRIGPNHLHISEPSFYDTIYGTKAAFLKDPVAYDSLDVAKSLPAIVNPNRHRAHRNVLNRFFSKSNVAKKSGTVQTKINKAVEYIREHADGKNVIDIELLFRRVSMDIISQTLFGHSFDLIDRQEEKPVELEMLADFVQNSGYLKQFPILKTLSRWLPSFSDTLRGYRHFQTVCASDGGEYRKMATNVLSMQQNCAEKIESVEQAHKNSQYDTGIAIDTIFDEIITSNKLLASNRYTKPEMIDEAHLFLVAGTGGVSYTLGSAIYYLLQNPRHLLCLTAEIDHLLASTSSSILEWGMLAKAPYLTAVVRETLRLASPIPGSLPRVVPPCGAWVDNKWLPPGTVVSMSSHIMHHNPTLFDQPMKFQPERWLGPGFRACEKWHVSFSRGPRRCLGMNLAYMEMHMLLAHMIANFTFELYQTDEDSMTWVDKGIAVRKSTVKVTALCR